MSGLIGTLFGFRATWAVVGLSAALSWHYIDKAAAVRSAKDALADQIEIEALTAERDAARDLAQKVEAARLKLGAQVKATAEESAELRRELEAYEQNTVVNPDGVVDRSVFERLRNR